MNLDNFLHKIINNDNNSRYLILLPIIIILFQSYSLLFGNPDKQKLYKIVTNGIYNSNEREKGYRRDGVFSFYTDNDHFLKYRSGFPKYNIVKKELLDSKKIEFYVSSLSDSESIFEIVADGRVLVSYDETCSSKSRKSIFSLGISICIVIVCFGYLYIKKLQSTEQAL